jgi:hypothetical protein
LTQSGQSILDIGGGSVGTGSRGVSGGSVNEGSDTVLDRCIGVESSEEGGTRCGDVGWDQCRVGLDISVVYHTSVGSVNAEGLDSFL